MITKKVFRTPDIGEIAAYTLDNEKGLCAEILTLGGIVKRLVFCGTDVVLGCDKPEDYLAYGGFLGAIIGRNANRIEGAEFELGGKLYKLSANDSGRNNNLHAGPVGFSEKVWNAKPKDGEEPSLILSLFSPDGDQGFPGNLNVTVTYTVTCDNSLKIHYEGISDSDTVINMTNHSYFNLNGHTSGKITEHKLLLNCDFYTPNNEHCVPDGSIFKVHDTPFDFTKEKSVGQDIKNDCFQVKAFGGYDHNLVIRGRGKRKFTRLTGDKTGIVMEGFTDAPCVQLYTGNNLTDNMKCKDNTVYSAHFGLCLETQGFPNAPKHSNYPSTIIKKGEKYESVTEYKFTKK